MKYKALYILTHKANTVYSLLMNRWDAGDVVTKKNPQWRAACLERQAWESSSSNISMVHSMVCLDTWSFHRGWSLAPGSTASRVNQRLQSAHLQDADKQMLGKGREEVWGDYQSRWGPWCSSGALEFSILQGERRQEADFISQYRRLLAPKAMNPSFCLLATQPSHKLIASGFFPPSFFNIPKERHSSLS